MKEKCNILLSLDGPYENVLKFKPPLVFNQANAEFLIANLSEVLTEAESLGVKSANSGLENVLETKCSLENQLTNGTAVITDYV